MAMRDRIRFSSFCSPFILLALASSVQAQTFDRQDLDPVESALDERIDAFFKNVNRASVTVREALDDLLVDSPLADSEDLATLAEEINQIAELYGPMLGSELIEVQRVGSDIVLLKYIYKCEDYPIVWRFSFYRHPSLDGPAENGKWNIITFRFNTQIEPAGF